MTLPSFILGLITSTFFGAIFHLWKNGGFLNLIIYLFLAWMGFLMGHILGTILNVSLFIIGPLNFGMATAFSVIFLIIGHWLVIDSIG